MGDSLAVLTAFVAESGNGECVEQMASAAAILVGCSATM